MVQSCCVRCDLLDDSMVNDNEVKILMKLMDRISDLTAVAGAQLLSFGNLYNFVYMPFCLRFWDETLQLVGHCNTCLCQKKMIKRTVLGLTDGRDEQR